MTFDARTPDVRALTSAVAVGGIAGLAVGAAYLAGGLARSALIHTRPAAAVYGARAGLTAAPAAPGSTGLGVAGRGVADLGLRNGFALAVTPQASSALLAAQPFRSGIVTADGRDAQCLAQAVYYEARGESAPGQQAVAQVVLNRVRHPAFPKTICKVVYQHAAGGCQFSFACNGALRRSTMDPAAWRRAVQVAERAIGGGVMAEVGDATQFQAARGGGWASGLLRVAQVGAHVFYRLVGRSGHPPVPHGRADPAALEARLQVAIGSADPRTPPARGELIAPVATAVPPQSSVKTADGSEKPITVATAQP